VRLGNLKLGSKFVISLLKVFDLAFESRNRLLSGEGARFSGFALVAFRADGSHRRLLRSRSGNSPGWKITCRHSINMMQNNQSYNSGII
jgi:hypothetical protein